MANRRRVAIRGGGGMVGVCVVAVIVLVWMVWIELKAEEMQSPSPPLPPVASSRPPNVLLLIADDFKPLLTAYGRVSRTTAKMTNLDRLASESIVFRNAHAQLALCGPSRASFLTSLRPDTLKIYDLAPNALGRYVRASRTKPGRKEALVLPKLFKLTGYATYGVGKHVAENDGMILSDASLWMSPTYNIHKLGGRPKAFPRSPYEGTLIDGPDVEDDFFADGQAARLAAKLISEDLTLLPPHQPWFLVVGLWKPHVPWNAPKKYFDMAGSPEDYSPCHHHADIVGLSAAQQALTYGPGCYEVQRYNNKSFVLDKRHTTDDNLRRANRAYHAAALYMDAQMGVILDALDKSTAKDDTIVVFLSDHGFHLGDHGLYCKQTVFDQATKVPFMIRPPLRELKWQRGAQSFAPVELLDLMPTLYDLAGLTLDRSKYQSWEGSSLMPILHNPDSAWVKFGAISQYIHNRGSKFVTGYSIRTVRYRLTTWARDFTEIYDYLEDEWESSAVAAPLSNQTRQAMIKALRSVVEGNSNNNNEEPIDMSERDAMRRRPPTRYT